MRQRLPQSFLHSAEMGVPYETTDVFDALVSRRSYKKPFTFGEAMQIIREGSGKHFDPQIVDAFCSAEEAVRAVEQDFSRRTNESGCFERRGQTPPPAT